MKRSDTCMIIARWKTTKLETGLTVRLMNDGTVKLYSRMPRRCKWAGGWSGPTAFWLTQKELEEVLEVVRSKLANATSLETPAGSLSPAPADVAQAAENAKKQLTSDETIPGD